MSTALTVQSFSPKECDLIRNTVAKDCDNAEFDTFIHICKGVRLDPLRRQIYAFVFNKETASKRQMVVVTAIGGLRSIAERTGNYRPDNRTPRITYDPALVGPANPLGIVKAEVSVFKFSHGDWHEAVGEAFWDDYAPIVKKGALGEEWVDTGEVYPVGHAKAGKPKMRKAPIGAVVEMLDPSKPGWQKGRIMLPKCAEAQALRRAWPDDFASIEAEEEVDRRMIDITPSEAADLASVERKLALVGGKDAITVDWLTAGGLERVPLAKFADAVLAYGTRAEITGMEFKAFWQRNLPARTEFKAKAGHDYLELQRAVEGLIDKKERAEVSQEAAE